MRWLILRAEAMFMTKRRSSERGAVAVIVALVIVPVLLAMSALAVDGGQLYVGRRQAQNGADAAAYALARACAASSTPCDSNSAGDLSGLVRQNGDLSQISLSGTPCVQHKDGSCAEANLSSLPQCPYRIPATLDGLQVRTQARLNLVFASIWGQGNASPQACASAVWGPIKRGPGPLPFTFSQCEYQRAVDPDKDGVPTYGTMTFLPVNYKTSKNPPCMTWNGHDYPGGFGWTDKLADCSASLAYYPAPNGEPWVSGVTPDSNGTQAPQDCRSLLQSRIGTDVLIPVFDCAWNTPIQPWVNLATSCPTGEYPQTSKGYYHIAAMATFHLVAFDGFNAAINGWESGVVDATTKSQLQAACNNASQGGKCLYGYFKAGVSDGDIDPNAPDFGTKAIKLVG